MKQKSLKQIYEQAIDLAHTTACDNYTGSEVTPPAMARIEKIMEIHGRYDRLVLKHFKQEQYVTNKQFNTPLPRSVYAGY